MSVMVRASALNLEGPHVECPQSHTKYLKKMCATSLIDAQYLKSLGNGQTMMGL